MIGLAYLMFFGIYLWLLVRVVRFAARWASAHGRRPRLWGFVAGLAMYSLVFWDLIPTYALHGYYCATRAGFTQYETVDAWKAAHPGEAEKLVPYDLTRPDPAALPPGRYRVGSERQPAGRWDTQRIDRYRYPSGIEVVVRYRPVGPGADSAAERIDRVEVLVPGLKAEDASYLNRRFAWVRRSRRHWFHIVETEEQIVDLETGEVLARYVDFKTDILGVSRGNGARGISDYKEWLIIGSCEMGQRMPEKEQFNDYSSAIENLRGS